MGLAVDRWFWEVLKDGDVAEITEGRIFNTARTSADEDEDRVPYVIITHDGLVNTGETKDGIEGEDDKVNIGVTCVAESREGLASLTQAVRDRVRGVLMDELPGGALDYTFSAEKVEYDPLKPCFWQKLKYACVISE